MKKHQMTKAVESVEGMKEMKEEILNEKFKNLENEPAVLKQLVIWKLAYGMAFICLKILAIQDDLQILSNKDKTWIDIIENEKST